MTFNPATDSLTDKNGKPFKFKAPYGNALANTATLQPKPFPSFANPRPAGDELPKLGFDAGKNTYSPPPADRSKCRVDVSPTSSRLQV